MASFEKVMNFTLLHIFLDMALNLVASRNSFVATVAYTDVYKDRGYLYRGG